MAGNACGCLGPRYARRFQVAHLSFDLNVAEVVMLQQLLLGIALSLGQTGKASTQTPVVSSPTRIAEPDTKSQEAPPPSKESTNSLEEPAEEPGGLFPRRLFRAYADEFRKKEEEGEQEEKPRRALPSPWSSPPFPNSEYQGFPLIGVPPSDTVYPLMKAVYGGPCGDAIKESRVKLYGWINASGNWSTCDHSNTILSYWVKPNSMALDQAVLRLERETD